MFGRLPDLSVVIPTRDRRAILRETLRRLERQCGDAAFEVIVVDDASEDGTREEVRSIAASSPLELELIEGPGRGPAAARNMALERAAAPVCLILNDDNWPREDLVARHVRFHEEHPEPETALLGLIALPAEPAPTPFMRWLTEEHFDFRGIEDPSDAGGERFYTANVSAKVELLRRAGGFDEAFVGAANEDVELGLRLDALGLRLAYDPATVVEHWHPIGLEDELVRARRSARMLALLHERHPERPVPRPPGVRHRLRAAALTALMGAGVRSARLRAETWRFLRHQAVREGLWEVGEGPPADGVRIGARLARAAARDPAAAHPEPER
jgi:glycosyltransferase involved in cell wall biosynthesis